MVESYDKLIEKVFNSFKLKFKFHTKIVMLVNYNHVIERMKSRRIDVIDISNIFKNLDLDELINLINLPENERPFKIYIQSESAIIVLSRVDDKWKISTVLDPVEHNKYNDKPQFKNSFYHTIEVDT